MVWTHCKVFKVCLPMITLYNQLVILKQKPRALDAYREGRDKWDEINNKDKKWRCEVFRCTHSSFKTNLLIVLVFLMWILKVISGFGIALSNLGRMNSEDLWRYIFDIIKLKFFVIIAIVFSFALWNSERWK